MWLRLRKCFEALSNLFLTNKAGISNYFISVEKNGDLISNKKEIVERFNQNYINILGNSSEKKPLSLGVCLNASQDELTVTKLYRYITFLAFKKYKVSVIPEVSLICENQLQVISTKWLSL